MKRLVFVFFMIFGLMTTSACREQKKELTPEEKVERAYDSLEQDLEKAGNNAKDAVEDLEEEVEKADERLK
ncbi:hypothetical protein Q2T40_10440 [Winogradskyella maritima]|uniref:Uncharacterized protein n=1 Tax=Winogradskyella maritima TaxID=1517766 RepID=A0ABV8AMD2_9FLAO|nr:hypothetical protein [Winogradskyella maritima]